MFDTDELSRMVSGHRADKRIYTDPDIFDLEMDRVFGHAWVYAGHESQVREKGDFFTARIGRARIIVARHSDDRLYAFHNRCTHRGSLICAEEHGNRKRFVCPYHAWTFRTDGSLIGVPHRVGYEPGFKDRMAALDLARVPRLGEYRGFIFASLADSGPDLSDYLGPQVRDALDNFVDRAPEGRLELVPGKLVQTFRANWKLQIENSIDLVHPPVLHQNAIQVSNEFIKKSGKDEELPAAVDIFRSNGLPFDQWDEVKLHALERGHCFMQGFLQKLDDDHAADEEARFGSDDQMRFGTQAEYKAALIERHGREKAEEILSFNRHNTIIYPNLFINPRIQQLRFLQPTAVDRTEQHCHVFRLAGAPPEALRVAVAFLTASNSPASIVTTDDHEIFERAQEGLVASDESWLDFSRAAGNEVPTDDGLTAVGTSELAMRNQHKAWAELMTGAVQ